MILEIVARSHLSLPFSHHICCSSSELPAHKRYRSRRASSGEKWTIRWCKTIQNDVRQVSYPSHHPCPYGEVIIDNHLVYLFFVLIFQANASLSQDSPPQHTIWHSKGNNPHLMAFNVVIYPGPHHTHGFLYADRKNNHQYFPFCAGKADMGIGICKRCIPRKHKENIWHSLFHPQSGAQLGNLVMGRRRGLPDKIVYDWGMTLGGPPSLMGGGVVPIWIQGAFRTTWRVHQEKCALRCSRKELD